VHHTADPSFLGRVSLEVKIADQEERVKAAVLGADGQLGRALCIAISDATPLHRRDVNITDPEALSGIDWTRFDVIVNAAAFTSVDEAETGAGRPLAWLTNAAAPAALARIAVEHSLTIVHYSSDYVFDGTLADPVPEHQPFSPLSVYGATKAAGDLAVAMAPRHLVLRTSWVVGDGQNFVRTMLGLARRHISPEVVSDQISRPTLAEDLATATADLIRARRTGTYNVTNGGYPGSRAEVARVVFAAAGSDAEIRDTTTAAYLADNPASAPRPLNSVLNLERAAEAGIELPDWRSRVADYVEKELAAP
jgi:dTDP-4-dehydrorhamnose reductase